MAGRRLRKDYRNMIVGEEKEDLGIYDHDVFQGRREKRELLVIIPLQRIGILFEDST